MNNRKTIQELEKQEILVLEREILSLRGQPSVEFYLMVDHLRQLILLRRKVELAGDCGVGFTSQFSDSNFKQLLDLCSRL